MIGGTLALALALVQGPSFADPEDGFEPGVHLVGAVGGGVVLPQSADLEGPDFSFGPSGRAGADVSLSFSAVYVATALDVGTYETRRKSSYEDAGVPLSRHDVSAGLEFGLNQSPIIWVDSVSGEYVETTYEHESRVGLTFGVTRAGFSGPAADSGFFSRTPRIGPYFGVRGLWNFLYGFALDFQLRITSLDGSSAGASPRKFDDVYLGLGLGYLIF